MIESRQGYLRTQDGHLYTQIRLVGVLPAQVGVVDGFGGVGVIGIVRLVVTGAR